MTPVQQRAALIRNGTAIAAAAAIAATLLLSGCNSFNHDEFSRLDAADRSNVQENYPLRAELQRTRLDVSGFRGHGPESSTAYFDTLRFVRAFAREGRGPLYVASPARGVQSDVTLVRRVIRATGLDTSQVRHTTRRDGVHAVTLAYDRVAAIAPESCHDQSPLEERRPMLERGTGFGCATQKNLATMIADPSELMVAAPENDRGSDRRAAVHKEYRETVRRQKQE